MSLYELSLIISKCCIMAHVNTDLRHSTHAVHGLLRWCLEKNISVLAFTVLIVDSFIA